MSGPMMGNVSPAPAEPSRGIRPEGVLRLDNTMIVDGTGAPAYGPASITILHGIITSITFAGSVIPSSTELGTENSDEVVLDMGGAYILPGLIDSHVHIGHGKQVETAEYPYKLWMGHGITTVRESGALDIGLDFVVAEQKRSESGEIIAPRLEPYVVFGQDTPNGAVAESDIADWVADVARRGAKGIKFFGAHPKILKLAIAEAAKHGLRTMCHHSQTDVARANAVDTAQWGLTSLEHGYGLPEALFTNQRIQDFPPGYNYLNEHDRFGQLGRVWSQAAEPGSERWNSVISTLVEEGLTLVPTFVAHLATRDVDHAFGRRSHAEYTTQRLAKYFTPSIENHGSFFFDWGTEEEVAWRENYRLWMRFIRDYHRAGGRVCAGSDSGFIYNVFGFGLIEELELLREAGLSPLEVLRAATLSGAELLGMDDERGSIEVGKKADLLVVKENPLANFKVLYGTGHKRYSPHGELSHTGGVLYTIKDGIVYDAAELRSDVRDMVTRERAGTHSEHF